MSKKKIFLFFVDNFSLINQDMMRRLPKEEREQIELQVEGFKKTKRDFEREVLKWDDRGNDIIVLAKKMCMIMMEMTDFTRQKNCLT